MVTIQFNGEWLDVDGQTTLSVEFTNNLIGRGEPKLMHTLDLSVPYTEHNAGATEYYNNAEFSGVKNMAAGVVSADGVLLVGEIGVVSGENGRLNLLFVYGKEDVLTATKLADIVRGRHWPDLHFSGKDEELPNFVPTYGWVSYVNATHPIGSVQPSTNPIILPCVNMGYLLNEAMQFLGYTMYVDGVLVNSGMSMTKNNPSYYLLKLPTCKTYVHNVINVQPHNPANNWAASVSCTKEGQPITLDDAGFEMKNVNSVFGTIPVVLRNYVLSAKVAMELIFPQRNGFALVGSRGAPLFSKIEDNRTQLISEQSSMSVGAGSIVGMYDEAQWMPNRGKWRLAARTTTTPAAAYSFESKGTGENALQATDIDIADNMPDMTLGELLLTFCDIICATYVIDQQSRTIRVYTADYIVNNQSVMMFEEQMRVVNDGKITRYLNGWNRRNILQSEDKTFTRTYAVNSNMVDGERVLNTIPFYAGELAAMGAAYFNDVEINEDGSSSYNEMFGIMCFNPTWGEPLHLSHIDRDLGVGAAFNNITSNCDEVEISIMLDLQHFLKINVFSVLRYRGKSWLVRSCTWSNGIAELDIISI